MRNIGVISDTHGLLRPSALAALTGCDLIIHAGDVGGEEILDELGAVAPVVAVRGNIDMGRVAEKLPDREVVESEGCKLLVLHDLAELEVEFDPREAGYQAVIFGHSHRPLIETRHEVLYFNPGSAGPRLFQFPSLWGDSSSRPERLRLRSSTSVRTGDGGKLAQATVPPPGPRGAKRAGSGE